MGDVMSWNEVMAGVGGGSWVVWCHGMTCMQLGWGLLWGLEAVE